MKKLIAAVLTAVIITGCGAVEIDGDTLTPAQRPAPECEAELYGCEVIGPGEVMPEPATEQEVPKTKQTEAITSENDAETDEAAQEAKQTEFSDAGNEPEAEEVSDEPEAEEGSPERAENDGEGDPEEGRTAKPVPEREDPEPGPSMHLWGTCTITFYCPCGQCCGAWAGGATASGTTPTAGRTVAADLPFGTRLMIEGNEYVVEDRGVGGMWVDIFVNDHQEALNRGMYQTEVFIIDG